MKRKFLILAALISITAAAQTTIRLTEQTLMHEMRATPCPLNHQVIDDRKVSFQWPLPEQLNGNAEPLDGMKSATPKIDKAKLTYILRYSQDKELKNGVTTIKTLWPMYNPDQDLSAGTWYWQYAQVYDGNETWSPIWSFEVKDNSQKFCPPSTATLLEKIPQAHPRVWVAAGDWDNFIQRSMKKPERQWYIEKADKVMETPMKSIKSIDLSNMKNLTNDMQRTSYLTSESRRIIDAEEGNVEALIRTYLLTKDRKYADEALKRVLEINSWSKDKNVKGDFNDGSMLSLSSMAYDAFYGFLTAEQKQLLLEAIRLRGNKMYLHSMNRLENHIADNHVWQMTFRIWMMAAFATYGEIDEAKLWLEYCYNFWVARMPGLNKDGGWHNGDSYFTVNTKTLIEVPYYMSQLTGFNFFSDPWYERNIMYTIFQQPPFSKSAGQGSAHLRVGRPNSIRVSYMDALAKLLGNSFAADYVRRSLSTEPEYMRKAFLSKPGDLTWFRLQCDKTLPQGPGLTDLPFGYVFPETGIASWQTNWERIGGNAMWSFRSSPYGSTSHALANQNAFNTFYGGKPIFYSSGHHIEFTDQHSMYCHRATRAHNTILVNGMGQRLGTEGYGWIPRYYVGKKVGYIVGDASNAYGEVISPLWLVRGKMSDVEYTPEKGWDKNHVKVFRRHVVTMGETGMIFIFDELEADEPVSWTFMLHTTEKPMTHEKVGDYVHVKGVSGRGGASDAFIFSSDQLTTDMTDQFFYPAKNWLRRDAKGNLVQYPNHWHFSATSGKQQVYRFATIIDTHAEKYPARTPVRQKDGSIKVGKWIVSAQLNANDKPSFSVRNTEDDTSVSYQGEATIVYESGYETTLRDVFPELEI